MSAATSAAISGYANGRVRPQAATDGYCVSPDTAYTYDQNSAVARVVELVDAGDSKSSLSRALQDPKVQRDIDLVPDEFFAVPARGYPRGHAAKQLANRRRQARLTPQQNAALTRVIVSLFNGGVTWAIIGRALGISANAAKQRASRAGYRVTPRLERVR